MNVKVNIAGQEIEVAMTPEQEAILQKKHEDQFMANFFRETSREIRREADFTTDETELLVDELFHAYPNPQELCEAIIADNYLKQVQESADGIVEERAKIYRVTVRYNGEFEVLVKARSEDEAAEFVADAPHYDLVDFVDAYEVDFEADDAREDTSGASENEVDFDATE